MYLGQNKGKYKGKLLEHFICICIGIMTGVESCLFTCPGKSCPYGYLPVGCPRCQCATDPCLVNIINTFCRKINKMNISAAVLSAIPNILKCSIEPRWHHSGFDKGHHNEQ